MRWGAGGEAEVAMAGNAAVVEDGAKSSGSSVC